MNTLKPCPFCPDGGDVQLVTFTGGVDDVVHCHVCGTILKHKIWQTRPIEDALNKRIAELEEKQRWIPASERLPEDGKPVWVCTIWNEQHSGFLIDGVWAGLFRYFREGEITHWMPLPKSPIDPTYRL